MALLAAACTAAPIFARPANANDGDDELPVNRIRPSAPAVVRGINLNLPQDGNHPFLDGIWNCPANTSFMGSGIWSDPACWIGSVPGAAGVPGNATVNQPSDGLGDISITVDISPVLTSLTLNNSRGVDLSSGPFIAAPGGMTLNVYKYFPQGTNQKILNNANFIYFGQDMQVNINGPDNLTISGNGSGAPVWVDPPSGAANTFGNLTINNGGVVTLADTATRPAITQALLGTGTITLDNGWLRVFSNKTTATVMSISKNINLGPGGGNLVSTVSIGSITGVISGSGDLSIWRGPSNLSLQASMTYTGKTNLTTGTLQITGGGSIRSTSAIDNSGTLNLINSAGSATATDRVNDAATITMNGSTVRLSAPSGTSYNETLGPVVLNGGMNNFLLFPPSSGAQDITLNLGSISRNFSAGAFFAGRNLGSNAAGTLTTHVFFADGTGYLVGGGGAAGSKNISIVPWAWGAGANTTAVQTGGGTGSLVTYDTAVGVRPLSLGAVTTHAGAEYALSIAAATASDNVLIFNNEAVNAPKTIGSLLMGSPENQLLTDTVAGTVATPSTISGAGTITVANGVVLCTTQVNRIIVPLEFGSNQAIIIGSSGNAGPDGTNGLILDGVIHGTGGLMKVGHGNVYLNGANTFTGQTILNGGRVIITRDIPADGATPNPFGLSTSPIQLVATSNNPSGGGSTTTRLSNETGGALTVARGLDIVGNGAAGVMLGGFNPSSVTTFSGNISIAAGAPVLLTGHVNFSGNLSGAGPIRDNVDTSGVVRCVFSGDNTAYTGEFATAFSADNPVWVAGGTNSFGTGTVLVTGPTVFEAQGGQRVLGNSFTFTDNPSFDSSGADVLNLAGPVNLGAYTVIMSVGNATNDTHVVISGNLSNGNLLLKANQSSGGGVIGAGTLELSGNNSGLDARIFVGVAAGTLSAVPGGVLKLSSNNALGNQVVQENSGTDTVELSAVNLPAANSMLVFGNGSASLGALRATGGASSMAGQIMMLGNTTISIDAASSLNHTGFLSDLTHVTSGSGSTTTLSSAGTATLTKIGSGNLSVARLADTLLGSGSFNYAAPLSSVVINTGTIAIGGSRDASGTGGATPESPTNKTSIVKSLTIAGGTNPAATLDLGKNDLIVDYTSSSPYATIRAQIIHAYNGGAWNGTGITSSGAAGSPAGAGHTALAYAEQTSIAQPNPAIYFSGYNVDSTSVLVRYTYAGDANLDGTVDTLDFNVLAANFSGTNRDWVGGDFNYDGTADTVDFNLLVSNFSLSLPAEAGRPAGFLVPEPIPSLLMLFALGARRQRRRLQMTMSRADTQRA